MNRRRVEEEWKWREEEREEKIGRDRKGTEGRIEQEGNRKEEG